MNFGSGSARWTSGIAGVALGRLGTALLATLMLSCQTMSASDAPSVDAGEQTEAPPAPPATVAAAILPPVNHNTHSLVDVLTTDTESRFDIHVNGAPGASFFLSLVENTSYSVVLHPDITGEITLSLSDATLTEVLAAVRNVYGYDIQRDGQRIYVMPAGLRTEIFELNYLNLERRGQSQTWVSSGQISDKIEGGNSDFGSGGGTSGSNASPRFNSGSSISTSNGSNIWRELIQSVSSIIGNGEGRSVVTNPNAGLIVVRAMPRELRDVGNYLSRVEESLNRQVIIEARILEVTLSDAYQAGINWSQLVDKDGFETTISQTGGGTTFDTGVSDNAGNTGNLHPSAATLAAAGILDTVAASSFGGIFSVAIQASHFTALIELLENQGEVRTLSNPRISTMNNQKAIIKVGQDEFFVTDVSTTTVTGGAGSTSSPNITLTPFFSGIALDVTPQISRDNTVVLHIHPSVSQVTDQTKTITLNDEVQVLPLALSTIRESDSIVRAHSGQVVVIGGLMQDLRSERDSKVPFLGNIPILGRLFKQEKNISRKSELVILLRPIVVGAETWGDYAGSITRSIDSLSRDPSNRSGTVGFDPRPPYSSPAEFKEY
ncbi:MAG: pilus (MSHA type) biogenesis protein MshL [Myxococcales bacterium]|nr:pilus (MSHA type) biogenesis protein MshL [Myxococcales bacterium]